MDNILAGEIYQNRISQGLTQDKFGKVYNVSGPAIFKFEKGYLKPSFQLWLRMAKDFKIPEKKAVLMWIKSRLPSEYQSLIDLREMVVTEEGKAYGEAEKRIMRLDEAKTIYHGEWIAFRACDESNNPEGEVILHYKDRWTFDRELIERGVTDVYITFAGPLVKEGFSVMFQVNK